MPMQTLCVRTHREREASARRLGKPPCRTDTGNVLGCISDGPANKGFLLGVLEMLTVNELQYRPMSFFAHF